MFIKFDNKRASFKDGNLLVGYSQATLPEYPVVIDPPVIELLNFPTTEFNDVGTVYNALYPDDQLILILRHGHRTTRKFSDKITNEERLTNLGKAQCRLVGDKLKIKAQVRALVNCPKLTDDLQDYITKQVLNTKQPPAEAGGF